MSSRSRHGSFSTAGHVVVTPTALALSGIRAHVGIDYSVNQQLMGGLTGGNGVYRALGSTPALPAGLTAIIAGPYVAVSGVANAVGNGTFTLSVSDTGGSSPSGVTFSLQVVTAVVATVTVASLSFTQNTAITTVFPITASGGYAPYTYTISPALPAGLAFNTATGGITGTPTTSIAATSFTVTVTDAAAGAGGVASGIFSMTVATASGAAPVGAPAGNVLTSTMWAEINAQAAIWGDTNNAQARVNAIPTTGTVLAPGGNIATALAGVGAGGTVILQTGTYTQPNTGNGLLSIPGGRKLVAGPGQFPVVDLSLLSNFACVYLGNGSVLAGIEFMNAQGISIITFDTGVSQYSNGGTTGLMYNLKVHDSGLVGSQTDGTGISITGGGSNFGQNWCVVLCESFNCWNLNGSSGNTSSDPTRNGGNSDGLASHFGAGQTTFIGVNSHNNGDDEIDMWQSGQTWHYFCSYHDGGKVPGVTNGGDGNGVKLGVGSVSHCFYKTNANNNRTGGFNLNGNTLQPTFVQTTAAGNAGGDYINGVNPPP